MRASREARLNYSKTNPGKYRMTPLLIIKKFKFWLGGGVLFRTPTGGSNPAFPFHNSFSTTVRAKLTFTLPNLTWTEISIKFIIFNNPCKQHFTRNSIWSHLSYNNRDTMAIWLKSLNCCILFRCEYRTVYDDSTSPQHQLLTSVMLPILCTILLAILSTLGYLVYRVYRVHRYLSIYLSANTVYHSSDYPIYPWISSL